jgi:hypothetical protein
MGEDRMTYVYAALANFIFVFLKAFQQRNVTLNTPKWVLPTSYGMALTEVYVISLVVRLGYDPLLIVWVGTGAGLGALSAMYIHRKHIL